MRRPEPIECAILQLNQELSGLSLPEETDKILSLVGQQQLLLEEYVVAASPAAVNPMLIRDVQTETDLLIERAREAHADAAKKLTALSLGRSAVSAYEVALDG